MSEVFEPPRWKGGPPICLEENLPAFETPQDANAFHDQRALCHMENLRLCEACGWFHYDSVAPSPSSESNGTSRYHKNRWKRQKH